MDLPRISGNIQFGHRPVTGVVISAFFTIGSGARATSRWRHSIDVELNYNRRILALRTDM